ncbi:hypothetical protein KO488_06215 [Poseidonibacter lekithochrous]|uniref:hypothetical protein n=1 Tax=Poseidonibacter TaxID=2321187 RepID=UPI001C07F1A2|nr:MULTISPECIES: hypothetical protein [Poseidonibacter]MBU3014345.1 hypothetical protein [Poseidonibacter lekithochrous]MDO6827643.1 hypothetical protein [Poseidonibacter sp. 1_MG-2023]
MITNTLISKVLSMTPQGVGKWRKENRPIIRLIEKYFTDDDLIQFINTDSISRYDLINVYSQKQFDEYFFFIEKLADTLEEEGIFLYFSFFDKFGQNIFDDLLHYSSNKSNMIDTKVNILLLKYLNKYYASEINNNMNSKILEEPFNCLSSYLLELDIDTIYYAIFNFINNIPNRVLDKYYATYLKSTSLNDFIKKN